ncbi:MAG: hypothetical protein ACRDFW_13650, partial [bacterium]
MAHVALDAWKAGARGIHRSASGRIVFVVPALVFIAVSLQYGLVDYALVRDHAYYTYYGFRVAAGDVMYRDLVDNKTPLSMYLSALLIGLARVVGTDPLTTIRVGYLFMGTCVVALTAAIMKCAFRDRRLALMGGVLLATFGTLSRLVSGPEPKVAMLVFALLGTLGAQHGRWFLSGVTVGLAGLAWQPGWSFGGVGLIAILATSSRRWRDTALLLAGSLLPVLAAGAYFAWHGALRDAIWQTVIANRVHVPGGIPGGSTATLVTKLSDFAFVTAAQYNREMLIVAAGFVGLAV